MKMLNSSDVASSKKKVVGKAKSTIVKSKTSSHPPTSVMVMNTIKTLAERGGSSLQAIKKNVSGTYKLDPDNIAIYIRRFLKNAVAKGELIQTKGTGANGSFKLPPPKPEPKKAKKPKAAEPKKKIAAPKKEKTAPAEPKPKKVKAKVTSQKKPAAAATEKEVKPKVARKPKSAPVSPKKVKAPSKAKTTKATPVTKPKSPKPKKVADTKKASPKKTIKK